MKNAKKVPVVLIVLSDSGLPPKNPRDSNITFPYFPHLNGHIWPCFIAIFWASTGYGCGSQPSCDSAPNKSGYNYGWWTLTCILLSWRGVGENKLSVDDIYIYIHNYIHILYIQYNSVYRNRTCKSVYHVWSTSRLVPIQPVLARQGPPTCRNFSETLWAGPYPGLGQEDWENGCMCMYVYDWISMQYV